MPYVAAEAIEAARQVDLLSYLRTHEPNELVHVSGNTYCTREHDSLKISNGKWHWFSCGIGGRNALDYLVKVKGMSFPEAVNLLAGTPPQIYTAPKEPVIPRERRLLLPEVDTNCDTVKRYLEGRGIHATVIDYCIEKKLLFQTAQYKNALFVGYDRMGKPRYGALRSTFSRYKSEAGGSDKHYSFSITENPEAHTVHVYPNEGGISLEVKINREIRNYTESMFFGLSIRRSSTPIKALSAATMGTATTSCWYGSVPTAAATIRS